jgi:hypothetical protein
MFREHELLDTPEDDTILWRYLDLSDFLNLLARQTLYFANRREFIADPWEGAIPATTTEAAKRVDRYLSELYTELRGTDVSKRKGSERVQDIERSIRSRQATYGVNCWHKNEVESVAMWTLYTHGKDGVAIQTTVRLLKECRSEERRPIYIANVLYGDHETLPDLKERPDLEKLISLDVLLTLTTKRLSFAHETEVRLILDRHLDVRPAFSQILPAKEESFGPPKGEALKVDLIKLIERIVASPDYPSWAMDSLQDRVTFAKLPVKVEPSDLLRQPKV